MDIVRLFDQAFVKAQLKLCGEKSSLMAFLFHNIFRDKKENDLNLVHSRQGITVEDFRRFVEYYSDCGYVFVSPEDIIAGLDNNKKYILITFDDGYFSHSFALPILKRYKIPAVFFISTDNVENNKGFWWDVLYRESLKRGVSYKAILGEEKELKKKNVEEIEQYITDRFGKKAFLPICDIDRPFSCSELKDLSARELVSIGNHTSGHAILTNYPRESIRTQIANAQDAICKITGKTPVIISYPSGACSPEIARISGEIGLKLGITTFSKKNYLPLGIAKKDSSMLLGRFILSSNKNIYEQCELFRSDMSLRNVLKGFLGKH